MTKLIKPPIFAELGISRCESNENYDDVRYPNDPDDLTLKEDLCHFEITQPVAFEHYTQVQTAIKAAYEVDTSK